VTDKAEEPWPTQRLAAMARIPVFVQPYQNDQKMPDVVSFEPNHMPRIKCSLEIPSNFQKYFIGLEMKYIRIEQ